MVGWPDTPGGLRVLQARLASEEPEPWLPPHDPSSLAIGGVFAAFSTTSDPAPVERAWVAAVAGGTRALVISTVEAPYEPGLLALREGRALERAVRSLETPPDVLLVDATGRDHPRGAGLALHLGAVLDVPTVGVTDRPLVASADADGRLVLSGREVARVVAPRVGARPVVVHAAWRTDVAAAVAVVLAVSGRARTPEPLRLARFLARSARARDEGRLPAGWRMDDLSEPRFSDR